MRAAVDREGGAGGRAVCCGRSIPADGRRSGHTVRARPVRSGVDAAVAAASECGGQAGRQSGGVGLAMGGRAVHCAVHAQLRPAVRQARLCGGSAVLPHSVLGHAGSAEPHIAALLRVGRHQSDSSWQKQRSRCDGIARGAANQRHSQPQPAARRLAVSPVGCQVARVTVVEGSLRCSSGSRSADSRLGCVSAPHYHDAAGAAVPASRARTGCRAHLSTDRRPHYSVLRGRPPAHCHPRCVARDVCVLHRLPRPHRSHPVPQLPRRGQASAAAERTEEVVH